jgi:hypothetical protein
MFTDRRANMILLHPNILEKDGSKEFAVLPYSEFLLIREELQKYEDLLDLREAKEKEKESESLTVEEAKKRLGI